MPCVRSESFECASEEELKVYLATKTFALMGLTNFIDMKEVVPVNDTLKSTKNLILLTRVDIEKSQTKIGFLEENRIELQDVGINFM